MKPRRVFVTLELHTAEGLTALRDRVKWNRLLKGGVLQAQANVARPVGKNRKPKR